jgi:catechol 2,3-dioxygenase-like lactoylglutathione lyase family enzyme
MDTIVGAHAILYSKDPDADRAFLRDVLGLPNVDVGDGWLVFALPPSEVAVHPSEKNDVYELYLMVKDVGALVAAMEKRGVACTAPRDLGWGVLTQLPLPGGGRLGVYEPRHPRPRWRKPPAAPVRAAKRPAARQATKRGKRRARRH